MTSPHNWTSSRLVRQQAGLPVPSAEAAPSKRFRLTGVRCDKGALWLQSSAAYVHSFGRQSTVTAGTIFEQTRTPLRAWQAVAW